MGIFDAGGAQTRQQVRSENYGSDLTIWRISFGRDAEMERVLAGTAEAEEVYLSADGRGFTMEWARDAGDDSGDAVYGEIRRRDGRDFHGWFDAASRKLVQSG